MSAKRRIPGFSLLPKKQPARSAEPSPSKPQEPVMLVKDVMRYPVLTVDERATLRSA